MYLARDAQPVKVQNRRRRMAGVPWLTVAMAGRDDHADGDQLSITRHGAEDAGLPLRLGVGQLPVPGGVGVRRNFS
jgi:hypothetical protein